MTIEKQINGTTAVLTLIGRLDTVTAPALEAELGKTTPGLQLLTLDCSKLEYVSSAGLRVFLKAQKIMNGQGAMTLTGVSDAIREILDITGFSDILTLV